MLKVTMHGTPENNIEDSLAVTQSFCRLMLLSSLSSIPVYLGLFMIAVPFDVDIGVKKGLLITCPVMVFLAAALIFSFGFLTTLPDGKLENLEYYVRAKRLTVRRKIKIILLGTIPFSAGILSGTLLLVKAHL
jgi:hypothetical protein